MVTLVIMESLVKYHPSNARGLTSREGHRLVGSLTGVVASMITYQKQQEETFVKEGGIKERMTAARLGYRTNQREEIERLQRELDQANRRIAELEAKLAAKN